ncbi:MAG TPA: hypothetical protein PLZ16_02020 [Gammaproteobacteria bacterium]|nr:hypothetical protein [Gammaproteobacteria bacterium]
MKYLQPDHLPRDSADPDAAVHSERLVELHIAELQQQIDALPAEAPLDEKLHLTLDRGYALLEGNLFDQAWQIGRQVLDEAVAGQLWMRAVEACDIMFQSDRKESVKALAHAIWLGVTFPIDPELSVAMLQHLVDESPDRSDGAAVAAATAGYLVELRAQGKQREDLQFFTRQMLGQVARTHSQVEDQEIFDFWVERLELNDPEKFLPRLSRVLDILTDGAWWFDRDQLRKHIPE